MTIKQLVYILVFALGFALGGYIFYTPINSDNHSSIATFNKASDIPVNKSTSDISTTESADYSRIAKLEKTILNLQTKIEQLESEKTPDENQSDRTGNPHSTKTTLRNTAKVTRESLLKAGIDETTIELILQQYNDIELKKLELRDRAVREGFLGTPGYRQQVQQLNQQFDSLQDSIGQDSYDRYLYASGQDNRVQVATVISGSVAETIGIKVGDLIINYANQPVFDWRFLQQSTSQGIKGEYVNVDVIRAGQLINLWAPRGPLGVQLDMVRVNPDP